MQKIGVCYIDRASFGLERLLYVWKLIDLYIYIYMIHICMLFPRMHLNFIQQFQKRAFQHTPGISKSNPPINMAEFDPEWKHETGDDGLPN